MSGIYGFPDPYCPAGELLPGRAGRGQYDIFSFFWSLFHSVKRKMLKNKIFFSEDLFHTCNLPSHVYITFAFGRELGVLPFVISSHRFNWKVGLV